MQLNLQQEEVAEHTDGPCLVTAVPGSGKTATLTERVARLIAKDVQENNIVCVTFTNKAAKEMKERICKRLGKKNIRCFVGTFHKFCVRLLQKFGDRIGYAGKFTIVDSNDQIDILLQLSRLNSVDLEKKDAYFLAKKINDWRENCLSPEDFFESINENIAWTNLAEAYLAKLKKSNMIDFSGLLSETIVLLKENKDVLDKIQEAVKYLQVDEVQDTCVVQFKLIELISAKWNNSILVGDISQCISENAFIHTANKSCLLKEINVGDRVVSARGRGSTDIGEVTHVHSSSIKDCRKITTISGRSIIASHDHIFFANYCDISPQKYLVYLMYKHEVGYRVGVTSIHKRKSSGSSGYKRAFNARLRSQRADSMWFLYAYETIQEALLKETEVSLKYGVPQWSFVADQKRAVINQDNIDELFKEVNTYKNAKKLMQDFALDIAYPHHSSISISSSRPRNISVTQCSHAHSVCHTLSVFGQNYNDYDLLNQAGFNVKMKDNKRGWRLQLSNSNLSQVECWLEDIQSIISETRLVLRTRAGDRLLNYCPASQLLEGMAICVSDGNKVFSDVVQKVEKIENHKCIDINVDKYHNFIVNEFVVHNSIYRFRGARYQNIHDYLNNHKDCKRIELPVNYRSTPQIVKVADQLIRYNSNHMNEKFETVNPDGHDVQLFSFSHQIDEAEWVAGHIKKLVDAGWKPKDIAVLYRMNSMSEPVERALANNQVKYTVVGGRNFFDRKEIKDCVSMLRFILNPRDNLAFHRCSKLVKGVGDITVGKIEAIAEEKDVDLREASTIFIQQAKKPNKITQSLNVFINKFEHRFSDLDVANALDGVLKNFDYSNVIRKNYPDGEAEERIDNVKQMLDSAASFVYENKNDTLSKYLQMVSLISANDKASEEECVSLMSLHAAKGLEFGVVFVVGLEQDILPHKLSIEDNIFEGVEEERRLCYVGMTRAKKLLYISYCLKRRQFGRNGQVWFKKCKPSQFLKESGLLEN